MSKQVNYRSVLFSNVVDKLNNKYMNEESGTTWYPFSFVDNTMIQEIHLFGDHTIWSTEEDGYPYRNGEELEGEDFENAIMSICEEEYEDILNNLYGVYAKIHNRNFDPGGIMLEGIELRTKFFKEKIHQEEGKEVLKDEDKWFLTAAGFVLAIITYQKYVNFSMYSVSYMVAGPYTGEEKGEYTLRDHKTLEGAISTVEKRLQHMIKLDEIAQT